MEIKWTVTWKIRWKLAVCRGVHGGSGGFSTNGKETGTPVAFRVYGVGSGVYCQGDSRLTSGITSLIVWRLGIRSIA